MSKFSKEDTQFAYQTELVASLEEMYGVHNVEVHENGAVMHGYQGQTRTAHIIIRQSICGGYGDLGFVKEDGVYKLIRDDLLRFNTQSLVNSYAEKVIKGRLPRGKYRILESSESGMKVQVLR